MELGLDIDSKLGSIIDYTQIPLFIELIAPLSGVFVV